MSNVAEKQRWNCPGCQRGFTIAAGKKLPDLCPDCREQPTQATEIVAATQDAPTVKESLADPTKAKWKPLAVVLPQTEFENSGEVTDRRREHAFYADLAWSVSRFWFVVLFGPGTIACFLVHPAAGFIAVTLFGVIFIGLCVKSCSSLRI